MQRGRHQYHQKKELGHRYAEVTRFPSPAPLPLRTCTVGIRPAGAVVGRWLSAAAAAGAGSAGRRCIRQSVTGRAGSRLGFPQGAPNAVIVVWSHCGVVAMARGDRCRVAHPTGDKVPQPASARG